MGFLPDYPLFAWGFAGEELLVPETWKFNFLSILFVNGSLHWKLRFSPWLLVKDQLSFYFTILASNQNFPSHLNIDITKEYIINRNRTFIKPIFLPLPIKFNMRLGRRNQFKTLASKCKIRRRVGNVLEILRTTIHRWHRWMMTDLLTEIKEFPFLIVIDESFAKQRIEWFLKPALIQRVHRNYESCDVGHFLDGIVCVIGFC